MATRRGFLEAAGGGLIGGLLTRGGVASAGAWLARGVPLAAGAAVVGWPRRAEASVVLDTNNISNFTQVGGQPATPGAELRFEDASGVDVCGLSANDPDAANGLETDLTVTFQVTPTTPNDVDAGFQVAINDGPSNRAAIAACIVINGTPHIGLVGQGERNTLLGYPAFIQADWQTAPLTLKLRRTTEGGAQLLELNGVAPAVRTELTPAQVSGKTREGTTSELGCFSAAATLTAEVTAFKTERPSVPVGGRLTFTRLRIRDTDSTDRLRFRADYALGTGTNGIDPTTEPVTIKLSTPSGVFYEQTLNGFVVNGKAPKRRWKLNDAERARTGIEQLLIDEDPGNSGSIFLRDVRTDFWDDYFGVVSAEIIIGAGSLADKLTGTAQLVEIPPGSGKWRLDREL